MRSSVQPAFEPSLPATAAEAWDELEARTSWAQQFASAKLYAKILNARLSFSWIGRGGSFWYAKTLGAGQYVHLIVDAATGRQEALFDPRDLDAALRTAGEAGEDILGRLSELSVSDDARSITVGLAKPGAGCCGPAIGIPLPISLKRYRCDLSRMECNALPDASTSDSIVSPDGRFRVYARDNNLWLEDPRTGANRQITQDGVENFSYGQLHDQGDTYAATRRRAGLPEPLKGVQWSPDSRFLLVLRHDVRDLKDRLVLTEYLPPEGGPPVIHTKRMAAAGDSIYPNAALEVISLTNGTIRRVHIDPHMFEGMAIRYFNGEAVRARLGTGRGRIGPSTGTWWNPIKDEAWILGLDRTAREKRLVHIDLHTGVAKDVVLETGSKPLQFSTGMFGQQPVVAVLPTERQALWWSQRDGWGHLYLYDLDTGRLIRQLTTGDWLVSDLIHFDEGKRIVYFAAVGKEVGRNPYYRHFYRVSLDGEAPQLLTPENADHEITMSPDGRHFIDDYSTISECDQYVLRNADGTLVERIAEADISALTQTGWQPPERVTVKAADGQTDLYGAIYKPSNFDASKKYPIIELTYPFIWGRYAPVAFHEVFNTPATADAHALAELGAVVVSVDGRGTAYRSAEFHEAFIGTDDLMGAADHVAAIRNTAAERPYMDLDRIGVTGISSGGEGSVRAAELNPDFFRVVVSRVGPVDYSEFPLALMAEAATGMSGRELQAYFQRVSTSKMVSRLTSKNKILLIYHGADEQVPLQQGFALFQAFQDAGLIYDELIIPGAGHGGGAYALMRTLRYFAENLGKPQ